MEAEHIVEKFLHACAEHKLVSAECVADGNHVCMVKWSEHAQEHMAAMVGEYVMSELRVLTAKVEELEKRLASVQRCRENEANHTQRVLNRLGDLAYSVMEYMNVTKTVENVRQREHIREMLVELGMCRRCWGMFCDGDC